MEISTDDECTNKTLERKRRKGKKWNMKFKNHKFC